MRILIMKFRNIGDVLLSTPLIENLKLNYPNSKIDYALNSNCKEMITLNPNINAIFEYNRNLIKSKNILLQFWYEIKFISDIIKNKYDISINLTEGDRGTFISLLTNAKIKLGFKPRKGIFKYLHIYDYIGNDKNIMHTVDKDMQFIAFLGQKVFNKEVSIHWSVSDQKKIDNILNKNNIKEFVHIHPVSRWMFKCWDDSKMADIIDYIENKKHIKVIITASNEKKEKERVNKILSICTSSPINLTGKLSLKELAYLTKKSKIFFGVDSAPMHIAATNTQVVALFGASRADIWGPWDNNQKICSFQFTNNVQKSGLHSVISNTNHTIYYENGIKRIQGMADIKYAEIKNLIDSYLKEKKYEN